MGRYNFVSPGAEATEAIRAVLLQRAEQERRDRLEKQAQEDRRASQDIAKRQIAISEAGQQQQLKQYADTQANEAAGTLYSTLSPGVLDTGDAGVLGKSNKYRGLVGNQSTLPSTSMAGSLPTPTTDDSQMQVPGVLSAPTSDPGGQAFNILKPTAAQQREQADRSATEGIGQLVANGASHQELIAAYTKAGLPVPAQLYAEDPAVNDARDQANKVINDATEQENALARIEETGNQNVRAANVRAANTASRGLSIGDELRQTINLRKQFNTETSSARTIEGQYNEMQAAMQAVRAGKMNPGSQGVLVTFQKILDPTSVVRESEYARSGAGLSLISQLQGKLEKIRNGGANVPVADLEDFVSVANAFRIAAARSANETRAQIDGIADTYGLDKKLITRPFSEGEALGGGDDPVVTLRDPQSGATKSVKKSDPNYAKYIAAGAVEVKGP